MMNLTGDQQRQAVLLLTRVGRPDERIALALGVSVERVKELRAEALEKMWPGVRH